jgi:Glycosyl hydrolase family 26
MGTNDCGTSTPPVSRRRLLQQMVTTSVMLPFVSSTQAQQLPCEPPAPPTPKRTGRGLLNFRLPWTLDTHSDGTIGVNQWTQRIGGGFAALQYGQYWVGSDGKPTPFYPNVAEIIWRYGAVPVINWNAWKQNGGAIQPDFSAARIVAGAWNTLIDAYADGIKAWAKDGRFLVIRFNHEMNMTSGQFPWQPNRAGNSPAQFRAAWRHVVTRFYKRGCTPQMVKWFWCPGQRSTTHPLPLVDFWPGKDVVHIVGADCYNWGNPHVSLAQAFRGAAWGGPSYIYDTYGEIAKLDGADIMQFWIGETGTVASGNNGISRAMWWQQAIDELPTSMPACNCVLWFDSTNYPNIRISTNLEHEEAFVLANKQPSMHGDREQLR